MSAGRKIEIRPIEFGCVEFDIVGKSPLVIETASVSNGRIVPSIYMLKPPDGWEFVNIYELRCVGREVVMEGWCGDGLVSV